MTLFKLVAPSAHAGGVDKVFGQDWNDLINTLTGGLANLITLTGGLTMSASDITLAGNKIKTTNFNIYDTTVQGQNGIILQNTVANVLARIGIAPNGTNNQSSIHVFRTSDFTTNMEFGIFGTDQIGTGEITLASYFLGTGVARPINVYMKTTKLQSYDVANTITSYVNFIINATATFTQAGGLQMGSPTGGDKGAGTINVATNIFLNNTAYTNPDYVFEKYYTGKIIKYKDNFGAKDYKGLLSLDALEQFVKTNHHLPMIHRDTAGIVERFDWLLAYVEELHLRIFNLNDRLKSLEILSNH